MSSRGLDVTLRQTQTTCGTLTVAEPETFDDARVVVQSCSITPGDVADLSVPVDLEAVIVNNHEDHAAEAKASWNVRIEGILDPILAVTERKVLSPGESATYQTTGVDLRNPVADQDNGMAQVADGGTFDIRARPVDVFEPETSPFQAPAPEPVADGGRAVARGCGCGHESSRLLSPIEALRRP